MAIEWKKCNSCKKPIFFQQVYWVCNVSTCNRRRTGLRFCSVSCYDAHLPLMNHRDSWALEVKAPSQNEWAAYAAEQGDDAVWPPQKRNQEKSAEPLPSGGFGSSGSSAKPVVIRRRR